MKTLSTTILAVRRDGKTAMAGDGQVTLAGAAIALKHHTKKVRRLRGDEVVAGIAGATADAAILLEKLEAKLEEHKSSLRRAAVELAKEWRTLREMRRLEAFVIVADKRELYVISGAGDVIEPDEDAVGIGSGGPFAQAAAIALLRHSSLCAEEIALEAVKIAASICVNTNENITVEVV